MSSVEIDMEGYLLKRPRRRRKTTRKKLEFQKRYCCLTSTSLYYYKSKKVRTGERCMSTQFANFAFIVQLSHTAILGCQFLLIGWVAQLSCNSGSCTPMIPCWIWRCSYRNATRFLGVLRVTKELWKCAWYT